MDTQANERIEQVSRRQIEAPSPSLATPVTDGQRENGDCPGYNHPSMPDLERAVTPSTFKIDETPAVRDRRIRETHAMLESLLATSPEEVEEQKETWTFLKAALDEGRPPDAKLFVDAE
jgi:hypothetical protein